jgi:NADPH:quinone reductase-like Zn-dependent oxidoreductase
MKAIVLSDFGGVEKLEKRDVPIPDISDNEVLVKVKSFSINPVDIKTRIGKGVASRLKDHPPMILGWDFSGIILDKGKSVKSFKKNDEVFGLIKFPEPGRTYAEYVAAPESELALKPSNISFEEAAAASLAALTAWQILKEKAEIKAGYNILVHSASGGVGHYAIQMGNFLEAYVIGTSSEKNHDFVLSLGASEHLDYQKQKFEDVISGIDFVLDTIGGDYIDRSLKVLSPGGKIISIPSGASEHVKEKAEKMGFTGEPFSVRPNGRNMKEIAELLGSGIVKSFVSHTYGFDEVQAAHRQIESGKTKGKIVVTLT